MWWPQGRSSLVCLWTGGSYSGVQAVHHLLVTIGGARGWRRGEQDGRARAPLKCFQGLQVLWPVAQRHLGAYSRAGICLESTALCGGTVLRLPEDWGWLVLGCFWSWQRDLSVRLIPPLLPPWGWGLHHFFCLVHLFALPRRTSITYSSWTFLGVSKKEFWPQNPEALHSGSESLVAAWLSHFISLCLTFFSVIMGLEIVYFDHLKRM